MRQSGAASPSVLAFGFVLGIASLGWPQPLGAQATAPPSTSIDIVIQYDVPMKTRDGITLYADIYRPRSADKFPVILMRTPYDKSVNWAVSSVFQMVPRGYAVIIQDVRGRYRSEVNGIRSGTSKPTVSIPSNGLPHFPFPMAKSA